MIPTEIQRDIAGLAALHCRNESDLVEMWAERVAIMEADGIRDAERLALADIQRELEGRR